MDSTSSGVDKPEFNATSAIVERILFHARECFQCAGLRKTTIEDIAEAAGVVRQTIYNHFANKQEIFDRLTLNEMIKVHDEMRRRMTHTSVYADKIAEAVLTSSLVARENPYLCRSISEMETAPPFRLTGVIYEWQREHWRTALEAGRNAGELSSDMAVDEMVSWLALCQWMLQIRLDHTAASEAELRRYIRNFVVEPLLANHGPTAAAMSNELSKARRQLVDLKDVLAEQAIKIMELERRLKVPS